MPDHNRQSLSRIAVPWSILGRITGLTLLGLAVLGGAACGRQDGPGRGDPEQPAVPQRIVSLTPALTEILFSLDLGDRVVGVTNYCDYPPEARKKTKVGGYSNPSVEVILALEPDLVLVSPNTGNREAALAVRRAGARLVVVSAEDLSDTYEAIEAVARVCGIEGEGSELARSLRRQVEAAAEQVRLLPPVRVLLCLQLEPIIAAGRGTLPAEILELAGGTNILDAEGYPRVGIETVIQGAPEVILQARMDTPEAGVDEKALEFWKRWPSIPAVRDGRVHVFDGTTALRPGPRVADAVKQLLLLFHPGAPANRGQPAPDAPAPSEPNDGGRSETSP